MLALLFPGQGVQKVGMGSDFYSNFQSSKRILDAAFSIAGDDLKKAMFSGPEDVLKRTSVTQPAVFACSCAIFEALKEELGKVEPVVSAGHSLGEYSALYAAGAFTFEDGMRLVIERGRLMEEASQKNPGGMAAVIGLSREVVEEVCKDLSSKGGVLVPANFNSKSQIVVSGDRDLVERSVEVFKAKGAKRVVVLRVGGAFHSPHMVEAAEKFREFLEGFSFSETNFPVISNVDAKPHTSPEEIKELLYLQIKSPVEWVRSVERMVSMGVKVGLEIGPGSTVSGLVRSTTKEIKVLSISKVEEMERGREAVGLSG